MRIDIMTLFPGLVSEILGSSIVGRAQKSGALAIYTHDIRDYSTDRLRRVDDTPYGGGKGMLISAPPVCDCHRHVLSELPEGAEPHTVYMSPCGKVLTQDKARELSLKENLIILCGHYEGIDERALEEIVDEEISIGDYVLTGGELPACVLADCVARMVPGVLSADECFECESLMSGMLEYPQYTRPRTFHGMNVPEVLLEGNHAEIEKWRYKAALEKTARLRPDLL